MKRILPASFYNPLTLVGSVVAFFNLGLIVFLMLVNFLSTRPSPYSDLIILLILPFFTLIGVVFMVTGLMRQHRRSKAGLPVEGRLLVIDFNVAKHRMLAIVFSVGFIILTLIYAFVMYQGYIFTESDYFCGNVCHTVMQPEDTAHGDSYHAEVECSTCHVGSGTNYYLISKFQGISQLIDYVKDEYSRPIPVPLSDLRPAGQTCETCHTSRYPITKSVEQMSFYLSDKGNTPWTVNFMFKESGASPVTENARGEHWHSSVATEIDYATAGPSYEDIPWIRVTGLDGKETVFYDKSSSSGDQVPDGLQIYTMDCNSCHNRAGHDFNPADAIVNKLINANVIDPSIPEIKKASVNALDGSYSSQDEGLDAIETAITDFYQKQYPDIYSSMQPQITRSIEAIKDAYSSNYFPEMDANWKSFADNKGHMYTQGCFRCHDGKHQSDNGQVLSKDCSLCHTLLQQQIAADSGQASLVDISYPHPVDIGDLYLNKDCSECHGHESPGR